MATSIEKSREFRGSPKWVILSQAAQSAEGATTIPKGSRTQASPKRATLSTVTGDDMVSPRMRMWAVLKDGFRVAFGSEDKRQEGGAIPVGSLQVGSTVISRTKLAEILVTTLELKERSIVDIEDLFRRALRKAYSRVLDNALLSNAAAVPGVRPAGLLNALAGANTGTGDATGGLDSVTADLQAMTAAIMANNEAAVPVLLLNNQTRLSMSFITTALGEYVFQSEIQAGRILNVPVVSSGNVKPVDTAVMVDASSLAMALDAPQFDVSSVATIVAADAGPAGTAVAPTMADDGSGGVGTAGQVQEGINVVPSAAVLAGAGAGYTARSMFQTLIASVASFCGNAVDKLCELLGTPSWTISSQAA